MTNAALRLAQCTAPAVATNPAPSSAPVNACVVEIGSPIAVAMMTVQAAPSPTAAEKAGSPTMASGTSPLPLKVLSNPAARTVASRLPASVVTVAHLRAVR